MKEGEAFFLYEGGLLNVCLFVIIMMLMDVKSSRGAGGGKPKPKAKKKVVGSGFFLRR